MDRALVVIEGTEATKELVREAGELAAGVGAELVLLHVTTEAEFSDQVDALASIPEYDASYGVGSARDGAKQFAEDIGEEVLAGLEVSFEALGALGEREERILGTARRRDCDHIFLSGRRRSPAGKAVFGDTAQAVILNFDGMVTVKTGADEPT